MKSDNFNPKEFIERHELEPDAIFEKGFNLCFFDEPSKEHLIQHLSEAIDDYRDAFEELLERDINSQIDISLTVGKDDQYTCSLVLPAEIIKELSKFNIEISFSAYPASD